MLTVQKHLRIEANKFISPCSVAFDLAGGNGMERVSYLCLSVYSEAQPGIYKCSLDRESVK